MIRPRISVNLAISADGKISSVAHRPADWSSPADKARFRQLRAGAQALLVGRGTWQNDRMKMRLRDVPADRQPLRCVVSSSGNFDGDHPMFTTPGGPIHLLVTSGSAPDGSAFGPELATVHRKSLAEFLSHLSTVHGVDKLHCEGGGQLIRELAEMDAIDEFHATFCGHTIFGGGSAPTATGEPGAWLPSSRHFQLVRFEPVAAAGECFLSYERVR
jgi:2,5-diamino-6-(ribosylamino)-4(3H)-pyrimidinone 5'-phosphate reductase